MCVGILGMHIELLRNVLHSFIIVYACVFGCVHAMVHVWKSEHNSLKSVLSFDHVGAGIEPESPGLATSSFTR